MPLNLTVPCYLFIQTVKLYPKTPDTFEQQGGQGGYHGYKCLPFVTECQAVGVAWVLIALSIVGNIAAIVFTFVN